MNYKLLNLEIENVKRIRVVQIKPLDRSQQRARFQTHRPIFRQGANTRQRGATQEDARKFFAAMRKPKQEALSI